MRYFLAFSYNLHDSSVSIADEKRVLLVLEAERYFGEKKKRCHRAEMEQLVLAALRYCGIDIGAKGEIQQLVNELAAQGLGVLMISSELEELVEGSSRVVVLRDGRNVAELRGAGISQQAIIHAMAAETAD